MSKVLERKPVAYSDEVIFDKAVELGHLELRSKAAQLFSLGKYRHPEAKLQDIECTLASLQIDPYTNESVQAYKAKIDRKWWWKYAPLNIADDCIEPTMFVAAVCLFLFSLITAGSLLGLSIAGATLAVSWAFYLGLLGCCLSSVLVLGVIYAVLRENEVLRIKKPAWHCQIIEGYDLSKIPDFALQTAVDIRERCPGASIYVDECIISERIISERVLDPFLVIIDQYNVNRRFVEVWDESDFRK